MMNIKALTTASDLTGVLLSRGVTIEPVSGTPLSKMNRTLLGAGLGVLTGVTADDKTTQLEFDPGWAAMMVDQSQVTLPTGEPGEYQRVLMSLVEDIAASVSGTVNFARNVVNPIIRDICENISGTLDAAGRGGAYATNDSGIRFALSNSSLVININEEGPSPLYLDTATEEVSNARMRVPFANARSPVSYPQMSSVDLMDFLERNSKTDLQRDLVATLKNTDIGYDVLLNTYNEAYCFQAGRVTGITINQLRNDMTDRPLILLALGMAILNEIPDGTNGSATNLETEMIAWMTQLKNIVSVNVEVYKKSLEDGTIVNNAFTSNFETNVMVNRENYRKYLEDAGSVEALLGCVFTDRDYDPENLVRNHQRYEEAYERRVAEAASYNSSNRLAIFKEKLRELINLQINDVGEDDIRPMSKIASREALDAELKRIYVDALDHPHRVVRHVVCATLFAGTDVEEILVNIDNKCDKDEKLSVRDAGALVVLDYLTKYLVSQMCVKRTL